MTAAQGEARVLNLGAALEDLEDFLAVAEAEVASEEAVEGEQAIKAAAAITKTKDSGSAIV